MYRLLLILLAPPVVVYTLRRALRDGGWRYLKQRFGYGLRGLPQGAVWLHCASVGEVHAAAPLANRLAERWRRPVLITTNTPTGAAAAAKRCPTATHAYLPVDWNGCVRRFLDAGRPALMLVMETELWPNLFERAAARELAPIIVNGRISPRTSGPARWFAGLYRRTLAATTLVLARNAEDRERFIALGADPARVMVAGNLKFAPPADRGSPEPASPLQRRYWLAASTHAPEEEICAGIQAGDDELPLLVIAPRHPERREEIVRAISNAGLDCVLRSSGQPVAQGTRVYLADTLGELGRFLAHAEMIFMGGSLARHGGQNILEAAHLGQPVIVGPHMYNFADELRRLLEAGAIVQVGDAPALAGALRELLRDETRRAALTQALTTVLGQETQVLDRYVAALESLPAAASLAER